MERNPVKSSNIAEVGYDSGSQILEIKFKNGGVYQYAGVDPAAHAELMKAESIGHYLHGCILGKCECKRIMEGGATKIQ